MTIPSSIPRTDSFIHCDWPDDTPADLPTEKIGRPPAPESNKLCTWISKLFNYLTGTFGEKLSPSRLNSTLDALFTPQDDWAQGPSFEHGGIEQTAWRAKQSAGVTYVVSAPAHDLQDENSSQAQLSGGRSTAQTLEEITAAYTSGSVKALIPIAQSNQLGCFGIRGHFVLLEVNIDEGKIQSAQIHDSKSNFIDAFYDGADYLTQQLRGNVNLGLGEDFAVTSEHRGEQSLLNGKDCGRYAAYYASTIVNQGDLSQAKKTDAKAFFKQHFTPPQVTSA